VLLLAQAAISILVAVKGSRRAKAFTAVLLALAAGVVAFAAREMLPAPTDVTSGAPPTGISPGARALAFLHALATQGGGEAVALASLFAVTSLGLATALLGTEAPASRSHAAHHERQARWEARHTHTD
jgi:hypothetical protein